MEHQELDHVYLCPRCTVDTLHYIVTRKNDLVGIVCSRCHTPSLVKRDLLTYHQLKWEDELRQILNNIENPFDDQ